jgi:hypothetical protein
MVWYDYPLQVLSGILVANGVPHFCAGIIGRRFQTPFAKPPGVGESSALVNILWGAANFAVGGILLYRHPPAGPEALAGWLLFAAGFLFAGSFLFRYFFRIRTGR